MAKSYTGNGGALPVNVPSKMPPAGPKQSSGKTKHARMQVAPKVETSGNLPKIA